MKSSILAGLLLTAMLAAQSGSAVTLPGRPGKPVVNVGQNDEVPKDFSAPDSFSERIWAEVAGEADVFSPLSAYLALAMVSGGARGSTLDSFGCLGIGSGEGLKSADEVGADMRLLIDSLSKTEGSTKLSIANSVWVDKKYKIRGEFSDFLNKYYAADTFNTVLANSVGDVNAWINDKTNGMIPDMLDEITPDVVMLLINAIYMDAKWADPFDKYSTHPEYFTDALGKMTKTEMMHKTSYLKTIDAEGLEGVVLPYDDGRLQFVALMPTDNSTNSELISRLNGASEIGKLADASKGERVALTLPKLELETKLELNDPLIALGMGKIFSADADFTGLCEGTTGLAVSQVLQKAKLKLDEDGTEAAAATVISVKRTSIGPTDPPRVMSFDKPFVWAVVDSTTGSVLFCGQVDSIG